MTPRAVLTFVRLSLVVALGLGRVVAAPAQQATLTGTVSDSATGTALDAVHIELVRDGVPVATAATDLQGRFSLSLPAGRYLAVFARLDYQPVRRSGIDVGPGATVTLTIRLQARPLLMNPVVVSASRVEEKALDAPASVSVIDTRTVEERPALTPIDHVMTVTGMDVASKGMAQFEVVARGFGNVSSGTLLVLSDNRMTSVPSLRINTYNFIPLTNEDIERIEVVRGPGAALYGPNSANGVLHLITRSPFEAPGTTVSVTGGERSLFSGQFRHAATLGAHLGIKASTQYMRGNDWLYEDAVEQGNRLGAINRGADPDTLRIGRRDTTMERFAGELRLDWRPSDEASVVTSVGMNDALSNVDLTPLGAAQLDGWRYLYAQGRVHYRRFFGQMFLNASDAGDTYLLRSGEKITDKSQMFVAQLQHGTLVGSALNLTYGLDLERTVPRTEGTITGRNEGDDHIDEGGAYLHAEAELTRAVRVVTAARVDYHNRVQHLEFSPRAALVLQPNATHTFRLSYNRAFGTASTNNLFLDLVAGAIPSPIPIPVRLVGVPSDGFSFRRDCDGGLCMYSPYTRPEDGGPGTALPLDATLLWPVLVDTLLGRGIDISPIPAPSGNDVATVLGRLDIGTGAFEPVTDVSDIPPLRPTITNVVELGYRAVLWDRVSLGVDLYHTWKRDFIGAEQVETPNAFFDRAALTAYFANFMSADTAAMLAGLIAAVPVGTVTPREARDPYDVLVTYRNFGSLRYWGADFQVGAVVSPSLAVRGSFSWTSTGRFPVVDASGRPDTLPYNAPTRRGSFSVLYRHDGLGLNAEVRGRAVEGFYVNSGVYAGNVESYAVLDALLGYRFPFAPNLSVAVSALNVLGNRHREFVGVPEIGRLVTARLRTEF